MSDDIIHIVCLGCGTKHKTRQNPQAAFMFYCAKCLDYTQHRWDYVQK